MINRAEGQKKKNEIALGVPQKQSEMARKYT